MAKRLMQVPGIKRLVVMSPIGKRVMGQRGERSKTCSDFLRLVRRLDEVGTPDGVAPETAIPVRFARKGYHYGSIST